MPRLYLIKQHDGRAGGWMCSSACSYTRR